MANYLKSNAGEVIVSQLDAKDYKDCGKQMGDYTLTRLPRGDEYSHTEFIATKYKTSSGRGKQPKKSAETIREEQMRLLRAKESDAMKLSVDVEHNIDDEDDD